MTQLNAQNGTCVIVTAYTEGPQGPPGPPGVGALSNLDELADVDTTGKVDKAVLYYNASTGLFKADSTWTTNTLTDGGAF